MMREGQVHGAQEIGVRGEQTHREAQQDRHGKKSRCGAVRFQTFRPESGCQNSQADKREHIPVRRRLVIEREQKIKREDRQAEPDQVKDFEMLPGPAPVRYHGPGEREEKQGRKRQEMRAEKPEHFERTNAE